MASASRNDNFDVSTHEKMQIMLDRALNAYDRNLRHSIFNMRYEEMMAEPVHMIQQIAQCLSIEITLDEAFDIEQEVDGLRGPSANSFKHHDDLNLMHPLHRQGGGKIGAYKEVLAPETITFIENSFGGWLQSHGYMDA
jgi:hypothetical protein